MYISLNQISLSTLRLEALHAFFGFAFLAVKKAGLPVGKTETFTSTYVTSEILSPYYRLLESVPNYFSPFATSNPSSRWISSRYASTSLQRIMADTFGRAFIHSKGSSRWGWVPNYIQILDEIRIDLHSSKIPLLDISIWLHRDRPIAAPDNAAAYLKEWFLREFKITASELSELFIEEADRPVELDSEPYDKTRLLNLVGWPEGGRASTGTRLGQLVLKNVGPTADLEYRPTSGLNVIVGDNSVGKTFLLDAAWWGLTGAWGGYPAEPKDRNAKRSSEIRTISSDLIGREEKSTAIFESIEQEWQRAVPKSEGFGLYARHDGSFAVWDTLRPNAPRWRSLPPVLVFQKLDVWEGLTITDGSNRRRHVSKGMIQDLVDWQTKREHATRARLFSTTLATLAQGTEIIGLGPTGKMPDEVRPVPTIRMPYGNVPLPYASAGTQRALSIAYLLVWAWMEHVEAANSLRREPYQSAVLMLDELEAHLHPKWQRRILPAIRRSWQALGAELEVQLHIATHSPIIMASIEPDLDPIRDSVHILELNAETIDVERRPIVKQGSIDSWLTSEVFDLKSARSLPAEEAIERAKALQASKHKVARSDVDGVHAELQRTLPDDDPFWIRWNYFRERAGA